MLLMNGLIAPQTIAMKWEFLFFNMLGYVVLFNMKRATN